MRRIVVSEYLQRQFLDRIGRKFEVVYDPDLYGDRPHLLQTVADAEAIIIRNRTMIDDEFLRSASAIRRLRTPVLFVSSVSKTGRTVTPVAASKARKTGSEKT